MKLLVFVWDRTKEKANIKKHGVSFEEARTKFYDENAMVFHNPDYSETEDRFILLCTYYKLNTLIVCLCFRDKETVVRIASAMKADKDESKEYRKYRK